jgi:hypothetical protein
VIARRTIRLIAAGLILGMVVFALTGCAPKFTRERFDMIRPGLDDSARVKEILGKPEYSAMDVWHYESFDGHLSAQIFFGDDGRVMSKEWTGTRD